MTNARVYNRYDTAANWAAENPVLGAGELAFESDTGIKKVGDGTTAYNDLPAADVTNDIVNAAIADDPTASRAALELGDAATLDLASQAEAEAGTDNAKLMTPLRTAEAIAALGGGGGGGGSIVLISSQTISSAVAAVDFTSGISNTYDEYWLLFTHVLPPSGGSQNFYLRTSSNSGSSFDAGASDYAYTAAYTSSAALTTASALGSAGAAQILLSPAAIGNLANLAGISGAIRIVRPAQSSTYHMIDFETLGVDGSGNLLSMRGAGRRNSTSAINALRLLFAASNIGSGIFKLYGVITA